VLCLSVPGGVEYRENRFRILDKTRGEKRREPVPERSLQVRIERSGCRGWLAYSSAPKDEKASREAK